MKKNLLSRLFLVLTALFISGTKTMAQGMLVEVPLEKQINKSSLVIEGKVVAKKAVWNAKKNNIYTVNTVEVFKIFKGELIDKVEVITPGGTIDGTTQTVVPSLKLKINDTGVFTLYDNNISFLNLQKSSVKKFKPYSSLQGFYKYDLQNNTANNPFRVKKEVSNSFYNQILAVTKTEYKEVKPFNVYEKFLSLNQNKAAAPANIVFTPTSINAGAGEVLTINGTGFGSVKGTVSFANADEGGSGFIDALFSQILTWSDTQITVLVPSTAGTGAIRVTDNNNASQISAGTLEVVYALSNKENSGVAVLIQHFDVNGSGGITWQMNTAFNTNIPAKESFLRAFDNWRCKTGINWVIGATTSVSEAAIDDVSVITFDDATNPLDDGVLGRCTTVSGSCGDVRDVVVELDIEFNNSVDNSGSATIETWNYGPDATTITEYDFESVALHELGHGHQLGHVINTSDIMHYTLLNGEDARVIGANNEIAAGFIQNLSTTTSICGTDPMTNYSGNCDLGIDESAFENGIVVYPNPASGEFYIKNKSLSYIEKVMIYDMGGRMIFETNFSNTSRTKTIGLNNMSKGVYFVNVYSKEALVTKKLIVE